MPLDNIALRFHPNADPEAVETVYAGVRYETRRHAQWAVFFDALGINHAYRPDTFRLDRGVNFTPDFWLPALNAWLVVRSDDPVLRDVDRWKVELFSRACPSSRVWLSSGAPRPDCWHIEQISGAPVRCGMLLVDERRPANQIWMCGVDDPKASRLVFEAVEIGTGQTLERPAGYPADPNLNAVMRMAYGQVERFEADSWTAIGGICFKSDELQAQGGMASF